MGDRRDSRSKTQAGGPIPGVPSDEFLQDLNTVKSDIEAIRSATEKISQSQMEYTRTKRLPAGVRELVTAMNIRARGTNSLLTDLKTKRSKKTTSSSSRLRTSSTASNASTASAADTAQQTVLDVVVRRFATVLQEYHAVQVRYRAHIKSEIRKTICMWKPDASEDDIEVFIQGQEVTAKANVPGSKALKADVVKELEPKREAAAMFETSITEIARLCESLKAYLDPDNQMLDSVEHSVKALKPAAADGEDDAPAKRPVCECCEKCVVS